VTSRSRPPLGQHFLHSGAVLARIAQEVLAAAGPGEEVVEIGAGQGALTRRLVELGLRVKAIEIDPRLAEGLRSACPDAEVVEGDVLELDLRGVVAGNLPYYITSPILRRLCDAGERVSAAILLMQKEVAERVAAGPGSRDYGFLSVLCQAHSRPEILFCVPPGAFRPPPKVMSAVVRMRMEPRWKEWGVGDREEFLHFVQRCFRQKRKTLRNNLGREVVGELPEAGLRAEQLGPEAIAAFWGHVRRREWINLR
jgi:16S rRNA (adenine1518-N6/adenine1519-N6)-dimethyltransferase